MTSYLRKMQSGHEAWQSHNFPRQTLEEATLGVAEECGELCHAVLKYSQRIRGHDLKTTQAAAADAIGDIIMFLFSVANHLGLNVEQCIALAWNEIKDRDWIKFPNDGRTE